MWLDWSRWYYRLLTVISSGTTAIISSISSLSLPRRHTLLIRYSNMTVLWEARNWSKKLQRIYIYCYHDNIFSNRPCLDEKLNLYQLLAIWVFSIFFRLLMTCYLEYYTKIVPIILSTLILGSLFLKENFLLHTLAIICRWFSININHIFCQRE